MLLASGTLKSFPQSATDSIVFIIPWEPEPQCVKQSLLKLAGTMHNHGCCKQRGSSWNCKWNWHLAMWQKRQNSRGSVSAYGWPHGDPVWALWLYSSSLLWVGDCWVADGGSWRQSSIPEHPAVSLRVQLSAQADAQTSWVSDLFFVTCMIYYGGTGNVQLAEHKDAMAPWEEMAGVWWKNTKNPERSERRIPQVTIKSSWKAPAT